MSTEPVLNYDFAVADAAEEGGWRQANRYALWVGRQAQDEPRPYELLEIRGETLVRCPLRPRLMHLIPAGTPHRIAHLFAPWRVSDADTVYLRYAEPEGVYHTLITATARAVKEDRVLFVCPSCGHEMGSLAFDTRPQGMASFWPFLLAEARAFNSDAARRKCGGCGALHPVCYGFDARSDAGDEAAARQAW
ncbi:MAG TPA: hypothetical protein VN802_16355 [Stellaceae bacterium]|nr:hypothetical protein [Stellaceae bacterium]